ncbi:MAG: leucine-rich repeat domain-containing protein [Cyclobacteriaceae bacterium]
MRKVYQIRKNEMANKRLEALIANTRKDTIKVVNLSGLKLEEFPDLALKFPNMTKLDISSNKFVKLPSKLRKMDSLKVLIWTENDFDQDGKPSAKVYRKIKFPRKMTIEKLYLGDNQLDELPPTIRRLRSLEVLSVSDNKLRNVGGRLKRIKNLKVLNLDANSIDMTSFRWNRLPGSIEMLKLNKCGLTEISEEIYDLNIRDLQFRENAIRYIPDGISKMDSLRKLSFYKNQLERLPADFYELKKIESLDLYHNLLNDISPRIAQFDSLTILYLAHNKLYEVPEEIGGMLQLKELYLHHNQLNSLPASFSKLKSLKTLRVNDNIIPDFPEAILGMKSLEFLDISSNLLVTLPAELASLEKLKELTYNKNQIDFEATANAHVLQMIATMVENGVSCVPTISKEIVRETN